MRTRIFAQATGFFLSLLLAVAEGCIFNDCIYYATYGYQACGRLLPVESQTSQGSVMIEDVEGLPPSGCACVTEEEKLLLQSDPTHPDLDAVYVKIQANAQVECIALAQEVGADTAPCMATTLNMGSVTTDEEKSEACWYIYSSSDSEKCPLSDEASDDDVGTSEDDSGSGGGRPLPDLPGDKLP